MQRALILRERARVGNPRAASCSEWWRSSPSRATASRSALVNRTCRDRLQRELVETPAKRQVQIDALCELFALHAQTRCAGGIQRELALLDDAQVDFADAILNQREFKCALVVADVRAEDRIAVAQRILRGQCVLDLAERSLRDARVVGHGLFLLGGANLDLRLQHA